MGAYLSEPVTEKISNDEESDRVRYGVSSMQGWRITQEVNMHCFSYFIAPNHTAVLIIYIYPLLMNNLAKYKTHLLVAFELHLHYKTNPFILE